MAATVGLQWDPNREPDLAGYHVYDGTRKLATTTATTVTFTTISTGRRYRFHVTAFNATAESGPSNIVELLIPAAPTSLMLVIGGLEIR